MTKRVLSDKEQMLDSCANELELTVNELRVTNNELKLANDKLRTTVDALISRRKKTKLENKNSTES